MTLSIHVPVLAREVLDLTDPREGEIWVDGTLGGAGHAQLILERLGTAGHLLGIDQDKAMLAKAQEKIGHHHNVTFYQGNFDQLPAILHKLQLAKVHGLLVDLGFATDQMFDPTRGLSFQFPGPLDMRLNQDADLTAARLINELSEHELARLFFELGEEKKSRRVARRIVEQRQRTPITTTVELAEIIRSSVPRSGALDPATRAFQALRIAVNDELGALERLLQVASDLLLPGGRLAVISFHSLEDRRVKRAFQAEPWISITKKPVVPSDQEQRLNPKSRSAKLRVAKRAP